MPVYQLYISPSAEADLRSIYRYGLKCWGERSSDNYLVGIRNHLNLLVEQPFIGVERPELLPAVRSLATQSHILFYKLSSTTAEIIRILHNRQDPRQHL